MKISILILAAMVSCATTSDQKEKKQDMRETAVCRNTLQQGIHRNECPR